MFETYLAEAVPRSFHLADVGLTFPHPDMGTLVALDQQRSSVEQLAALAGAERSAAIGLCQGQPVVVIKALVVAIRSHYGLMTPPRGGWRALGQLVERHGADLEYDLHDQLGLDLLDWFRGVRPWSKLYRLIDRLPRDSRYKAALAMDPEYARVAARRMADAGVAEEPAMTPLGWSREVELLTSLLEAILHVRSAVVGGYAKNPPKVKPLPRPRTALQEAMWELERDELLDIARLFTSGDLDSTD